MSMHYKYGKDTNYFESLLMLAAFCLKVGIAGPLPLPVNIHAGRLHGSETSSPADPSGRPRKPDEIHRRKSKECAQAAHQGRSKAGG